jgi:hypothetical protein
MSKLIAIVAALAATSSLYVTSAGAGCGGGYGFYRSSYRSVARVSKPRIARKQSSNSVAAVVKPEIKQVAETLVEKKDETVAVNTTPVTEKAKARRRHAGRREGDGESCERRQGRGLQAVLPLGRAHPVGALQLTS